jgi:GMP synthase-like glutamine amidotransferase
MKILAVENYRGTHLGLVGRALDEAGAEVDLRRMYEGDALPPGPDGYDGLVVLGGGQDALADAEHPYLPALAALTRTFGEAGRPVLGICLGSQIVARGHGAENILGRPIEIGWQTVTPTPEGRTDPVLAPLGEGAPVFHWHTDTFTLPDGAVHLASSAQTRNQAFRIGRAVYGIQFHFEADRTLVEEWTGAYGDLLKDGAADWPARHEIDRHTLGPLADAVGLEIARAWVKLAGEGARPA